MKKLQQVPGVRSVKYDEPYHIVECPEEQDLRSSLMKAIVQGGWTILSMGTMDMSLEDIFLQLTTEEEFDEEEPEE